jgi:hypothetical protein
MFELLKNFLPTPLQAFYSLVAALLVALYWCRSQLAEAIKQPGSQESFENFQNIIKQSIDNATNNEAMASLSVAFIWALVGLLILAIVYETVNIFILLRNDALMASQFTHAEENKKQLIHETVVRGVLTVGYVIFWILLIAVLLPLLSGLISQPAEVFFHFTSIVKETIGVIGLAATIALAWRWFIILLPKFV